MGVADDYKRFRTNSDDVVITYIEERPTAILTDSTSAAGVTYVGYATTSSITSESAWRIMKLTVSTGNVIITWADGDYEFNNIWDNRTGLVYS